MLRNLLNSGFSKQLAGPLLKSNTLNVQQLRTTFVLKRRNPVPLAKKNQNPTKLRGRHFNYDLVEIERSKKLPNVDVILTTYVAGVGRKGEIVNVGPTFAYEKLLLPGLAAYLTRANIEKYSVESEQAEEEQHSSPFAKRTVQLLQKKVFAIIMNKDHPWVLEPWHIRVSLRKAAFHINNDSSIELPKEKITGPDLMKQNKEFTVVVTINNTEKAKVRCRIHHWSTEPSERLPYVFEHYKLPAEPLFGTQEAPPANKPIET